LERRCLDQVIERHPRFVLATGGSLVSEPATFERLLTMCFTVWLRATPEEHMQRVIAQGDMRPMADNRESMSDLRAHTRSPRAAVSQGRRDGRDERLDSQRERCRTNRDHAEKLISSSYLICIIFPIPNPRRNAL
jgi:XRE family aerobic/anaerobic benzoate catabolism transcriptional regulator